MIFNELSFLIFLFLVLAAYDILGKRHRTTLLLAASYYFYMSIIPAYGILLAATSVSTYYLAKKAANKDRKALYAGIIINLSILIVYKYGYFIQWNIALVRYLFTSQWPEAFLMIVLPIGISFYTFQALGYLIDAYNGKIKPADDLKRFLLFISFFPQLVAGPIERSYNMLPQLKDLTRPKDGNVSEGVFLMLWGYFKKLVIADNIAFFVERIFNYEYFGIMGIIGGFLFGIQIYCDFSGYTDIARGVALLFNIRLSINFNNPYLAENAIDFWRRWHITLSTWFRDYLYIPLGGSRSGPTKTFYNIIIVFFIIGAWHGANWTFILWGLYFGILVAFSHLVRYRSRLLTLAQVIFGWVIFRAQSITQLVQIITGYAQPLKLSVFLWDGSLTLITLLLSATLITFWIEKNHWQERYHEGRTLVKLAACILLASLILYYGNPLVVPFVYFQF
ncbi:MBOAT family O-acyltransferase [Candidatus Altiarchaeota archaeon]